MENSPVVESALRFESLCISVLTELGYRDETELANWRNPDAADFVGIDPTAKHKIVAEFKLTLSSHVRPEFITQAILGLRRRKEWFPDAELLLIVATPLPEAWMVFARSSGISYVWDLPKLLSEASKTRVFADLQSFLNDLGVPRLGLQVELSVQPPENPDFDNPTRLETKGAEFRDQINAVLPGREGWLEFERVCKDALVYLFGDQFGAWHEQDVSDDSLHRRDFLVRLRPHHDFWISLAHDFKSRYIVFEFKNYENPIGQTEIYSTEKYLFTTALRSVGFIIARNGADDGAYRAASGALREAGKLIVIISAKVLCEMLESRDRGEEPEIALNALLDNVLTKMLR